MVDEITASTKVQLGAVIAAFMLLIGNAAGVVTIAVKEWEFRYETTEAIRAIRLEIQDIRATKRDKGVSSWNRKAHSIWAEDLKRMNQAIPIEVPDPNNLRYYSED